MPEESLPATVERVRPEVLAGVDDTLIEKLWRELDGRVTQERIVQTVAEIAATYREAT